MKGSIFTNLADMVEEECGLSIWQSALDACPLTKNGSYSAGGIYPDSELMCLVGQLQKRLDLPLDILLRHFGEYLFDRLLNGHRYLREKYGTAKEFLLAVDGEIHKDIEKLYPGTSFPFIRYQDNSANTLSVYYNSPRKLCFLAEGLIAGLAKSYHCEIALIHSECVHRGDETCHLELTFYD